MSFKWENANVNIHVFVHCLTWTDGVQGVAEAIGVDETIENRYIYIYFKKERKHTDKHAHKEEIYIFLW